MMLDRPLLAFALLALTIPALPAHAEMSRKTPDRSAISDYVHARVADDLGELDVAAAGYAAALADNPGDTNLALHTLRQATAAGDMALVLKTAHALDDAHTLPPDGALLLMSEAIGRKDWRGATLLADRMDHEKLFAFLVPTMRAWIAFGAHQGDPVGILGTAGITGLAATYASEHRGLLLIAQGDTTGGVAAIQALDVADSGRSSRLRIAAAAGLIQHRKRDAALAMLTGDDSTIARARQIVLSERKLPGAIDSAQTGIGELLVRVAADINREQTGPLALEFARLGATLAPDDSEAWLVTASLLASAGADQAGLDALGHVTPDDPFIGAVRDARLTLLSHLGRADQALAEAQAASKTSDANAGDFARLADLQTDSNRFTDAAASYGRALTLAGGDKAPSEVAWPLLLQQANALLQGGDWPGARTAGEHALALAPQEPAVLNFLGYSKLERGEDVTAAAAMIAQAQALAPQDPAITDSLGWSWYMRGDLAKAIPLLEQAAQAAPAESDINEHLGDAYWKAGRKLEARFAWRAALVAADGDQAKRLHGKIDNGPAGAPAG